ncbi:Apoptosis-inducing factor-like protein B [Psilocybe cubensis]|uniref:Apoptosis-inducing factor-like protein B n=2 Tax=Psilocybe cubensis TaxID=181762 RepID=A0ACB8GNR8_PSICU|nr:Apoptosis-inducing factor-like protein B [Psilocybe cubensis]KAH9477120.1 Apoptosis-inducing factor-like protein B [Psilocybe cubensis]
MSKKNDDRKNIVIVGGGAGGSRVAHSLSTKLDTAKFNIVLIDARPDFILLPATARAVVSNPNNLEKRILVPLKDVFSKNNGTFIQAEVTGIEKSENGGVVVLSNEERIPYDILVLSPGSRWTAPFAFPNNNIRDYFYASRANIEAAQNIVLVGAGAVAIELAGEIADVYPKKSVTIVQAAGMVLNKVYPDKFRRALESRLIARNIELIFGEYVEDTQIKNGTIKTKSGKVIKADLVISTVGPQPNTEFIAKSLGSDALTENGYIKVAPTLRLLNHPNIYAVGDAIDYAEQKQYMKSINQANIVAANIIASIHNKPLSPYKGSREIIVITIGKNGGVAFFDVLWGIVLGDWFCRLVKSRSLMVNRLKSLIGL